jgi:glycosyltransferase involved in cell wall biosynthesis
MIGHRNDNKLVPQQARTLAPQSAPTGLRLLVLLPALNEALTIGDVIRRIPRDMPGIRSIEVVVIDDGSTDGTAEIARASGANVFSHSRNMGVGSALKTGLAEAIRGGFDIAVNIDSDGQFSPEDIPKLIAPIVSREADFVSASRFKDLTLTPGFYDVSCGFRAHSREAMLRLTLMGNFTYTQETFLMLNHYGLRMMELPIAVRGVRTHGESRVASNLLTYAVRASRIIMAFVRDYRPSLFFSMIANILMVPGAVFLRASSFCTAS